MNNDDRARSLHCAQFFKGIGLRPSPPLLALFSFVSLAEELEDVGTGNFTTADAVSVVLLTTPKRIVDLLPVSALLGAVLGLGAMANHREIIALRNAGLSPWRLARAPCLVVALMIGLTILMQNQLIPTGERQAQEFRSKTLMQTTLGGGTEFWSRYTNQFVRVGPGGIRPHSA